MEETKDIEKEERVCNCGKNAGVAHYVGCPFEATYVSPSDKTWTDETRKISEKWWNYWNYQGQPDRDLIQDWWFKELTSATIKAKEDIKQSFMKVSDMYHLDSKVNIGYAKPILNRNLFWTLVEDIASDNLEEPKS